MCAPPARSLHLRSRRWVTSNGLATPSSSTLRARGSRAAPTSPSRSRRSSRCSTHLARPRQPLRGGAGGGAGNAARAAPRRRADRVRGRDQDRPLRVVRRDPGRDDRAPRATRRARRHARDRAGGDGHAPLGRLEGPADHRHAALPPQRRAAPLRRLAQQHLRPARAHRHPRRRPRDRGHERPPQLPPRDPRPLGQLAVRGERQHRAALGADTDLHALLPALRRPRRLRCPGSSTRTTSASSTRPAPSPSTRSSGGASGRISASRPWRSGSPTASPTSPRRRRSPPSGTRSRHGSHVRTTRASRSRTSRTG